MCDKCNVLADVGEAVKDFLSGHQSYRELQLLAQRVTAICEMAGVLPPGNLQQVLTASAE